MEPLKAKRAESNHWIYQKFKQIAELYDGLRTKILGREKVSEQQESNTPSTSLGIKRKTRSTPEYLPVNGYCNVCGAGTKKKCSLCSLSLCSKHFKDHNC